jgi:acyl-CoA oxidase
VKIVVAQLILPVNGKLISYGPHTFIVQIRDMKTHKPLDGVIIGDIGPKYGYQSMDNGYMLFNQFRVPYDAMLSRYSQVDPNSGKLKKTGHPAVVYGSLTNVRANIVMHARLILARAVTVAVRYTAIRRQFKDRDAIPGDNGLEMVVLDYPTVQIRILPLLATTFALHYTGEAMYKLYSRTRGSIEKGDFSKLAELHSTSSGLKSLCTTLAADGIETCRRAMGGHGFGGGSGLVEINNE